MLILSHLEISPVLQIIKPYGEHRTTAFETEIDLTCTCLIFSWSFRFKNLFKLLIDGKMYVSITEVIAPWKGVMLPGLNAELVLLLLLLGCFSETMRQTQRSQKA